MQAHHSSEVRRPPSHVQASPASRSASFDQRTRSDGEFMSTLPKPISNRLVMYFCARKNDADCDNVDSWVEISSQPSSSSLSSIGDDVRPTALRIQLDPRTRRRRTLRPGELSRLSGPGQVEHTGSTSSQEEYEESESESDRVMTSSGEGMPDLRIAHLLPGEAAAGGDRRLASDDDDENKTAINHPINHNDTVFTPQPNAFSHPPTSSHLRSVAGSYFPSARPAPRPASRHSQRDVDRPSHMPQNILSPSYNAAAQHDEALRASLSTLLSCAAAARGLPKTENKRTAVNPPPTRSNRVEPMSLRLVPESALPGRSPPRFQEPTFQPTIRRTSTSTSSTSADRVKETKRKARPSSRERRAMKKTRQSSPPDEMYISPTLLTWVVSAGVVVFLSALSFSAGYSLGKEAGHLEATGFGTDEQLRTCAREAGRSSLGLKRSLARSAVQV